MIWGITCSRSHGSPQCLLTKTWAVAEMELSLCTYHGLVGSCGYVNMCGHAAEIPVLDEVLNHSKSNTPEGPRQKPQRG